MNKKNSPNIGHNKKSLLNSPVEHIDIKSFDARKIIEGMSKMSFTSRDTARAAAIYNEMLADKDCSIFLTLAGSTSAGGCMDLYTDLVKHNMVDPIKFVNGKSPFVELVNHIQGEVLKSSILQLPS